MSGTVPAPRDTIIGAGELAPDFTLKDQDRQDWRLSDALRSGDVVLCFYPLDFTSTCGTENECITREMSRWARQGTQMVGISCDSFAAHKAWADQAGFKHRLLADMHRQVCRAYGLYWPELNVSKRGTVVIGQSAAGVGRVKWSQGREPGHAMSMDEVLTYVS